jgi:membrane fusion protein (multidrug efflux system)
MLRYRLLHIIFLLFLTVVMSCNNSRQGKKGKEKLPVAVDIIIADEEDFSSTIEVNGTALSYEMIELHPEVSGRIIYLNVKDGARVKEGTLLVRINDAELQAQLEQQKNQLDLALKTEQRYKALLATNSINQSDYDVALSQVNNYRALVNVTLAQLDKTVIKAPFDGQLGLRQVSPGAYVTSQNVISTLQQTDKIKLDFTMPESYNNILSVGDTVAVQSNVAPELEKAVVIAIEPMINTSTRNLKARAVLINSSIKPGAFVKIKVNKKSRGIMVPSNAIIPDALSNMVIVVKDRKAVFKKVETGLRTADRVELTGGILAGDSIVVSGILFVRPGTSVKINKIQQAS